MGHTVAQRRSCCVNGRREAACCCAAGPRACSNALMAASIPAFRGAGLRHRVVTTPQQLGLWGLRKQKSPGLVYFLFYAMFRFVNRHDQSNRHSGCLALLALLVTIRPPVFAWLS